MTEDRRRYQPELLPQHRGYTVDGRPLLGVTTIIHQVLRSPQLEDWLKRVGREGDRIRDEAAAFGKSIHAGLEAHLTGRRLLPVQLPDNWHQTIDAGRRWIDTHVAEIYAIEEPIASLTYGYAGMPDLYCRLEKQTRPTILDFKTTARVYYEHALQTAAYRQAAVETYGDQPANRKVLHFSKDEPGKVTAHTFRDHSDDFAGFTYCLGLYRLLKKGGHR